MQPKPFSTSYSRIKTFESCPQKYYGTMVSKEWVEPDDEGLQWGRTVHKSMERIIITGEIPPDSPYKQDAERVLAILAKHPDALVLTEQQLAITRTMQKTSWFGNDVYFRAVVDMAMVKGPVGIAIDWKTGKVVEDSPQLMLTALVMFIHYPQLQAVKTEFAWLKTHEKTTETYYRDKIMQQVQAFQPRLAKIEAAHINNDFPAEPGRLCRRYCPVKSCPHYGT
jgi:hypothetical protein